MAERIVSTVQLEEPIEAFGQTVERLEFRRPTAGITRHIGARHADGTPVSDGEVQLRMLAEVTGLSEEAVATLGWDDFERAQQVLGQLMDGSQGKRKQGARSKRGKG